MRFELWDVVQIADFPNQEDTSEYTSRPVIVIDDLHTDAEIIPITKQLHQAKNYKNTIFVNKESEEGCQMGLTFDSMIVLDRSVTLNKIRLGKKTGTCPESIIDRIEELRPRSK